MAAIRCDDMSRFGPEALAIAKGDGRHARMLKTIARADLLILDDWGLSVLSATERRDLPEILEDRHGRGSHRDLIVRQT